MDENKHLFEKYQDKIIHIIDNELLSGVNAWINENHQRNSIDKGISQLTLEDNDKILVSDVDEIPDPTQLIKIKNENMDFDKYKLEMDLYYYNITCRCLEKWIKPEIISYKFYRDTYNCTPERCRNHDFDKVLSPGGWHLSYFGDYDYIRNKIEQQAHQEYNFEEIKNDELTKMGFCKLLK